MIEGATWRRYAESGDEEALRSVIREYLPMVYSIALRQTFGDTLLAQDVAQETFCIFAKKAGGLPRATVISAWLCRTSFHIGQRTARTENRRRAREKESAYMQKISSDVSETRWEEVAPHLDAAINSLPEADRTAIVLRFFDRLRSRDIAERLGVTEEAARMRISRAVRRLRDALAKHSPAVTPAMVAAFLIENTRAGVPAHLPGVVERFALKNVAVRPPFHVLSSQTAPWLTASALLVGVAVAVLKQQNPPARSDGNDVTSSGRNEIAEPARQPETAIAFDSEGAATALRKALREPWGSDYALVLPTNA